jgi:mono/diheme cytochrome c family protein
MFEKNRISSTTVLAALLISLFLASGAAAQSAIQKRGRVLADGLCGGCHATGKTGDSPHIAAPRFRHLDRSVDLDKFARRLRGGILSSHRDMPMFRFSRDDADAFVAYLRSVQGP